MNNHNEIALLASFAATLISIRSLKIARDKLRLDLYNRRFEIYIRVLTYCIPYMKCSSKNNDIVNIENNFIIALRESKFLFKSNSNIYESIKEINQICSAVKHHNDNGHEKTFYQTNEIISKKLSIEEKLVNLENMMLPYLRFDLLHRWYHIIL